MKSVTDAKIKITAAINIFIFIGRLFNIVIVLSPISNNKKKINTGIRIVLNKVILFGKFICK